MHGGPLVQRDDGFGARWFPSQSAVRSDRVEVLAPLLDDDPGLLERVENLTIQQFVAEPGTEALAVTVLPG